jgi:rubrerythrin
MIDRVHAANERLIEALKDKNRELATLKRELEAERAKVAIAVAALRYCADSTSTHRILKSVEAMEALAALQAPEVKHVCGAAGYGQSIYDRCPACEASEVKP